MLSADQLMIPRVPGKPRSRYHDDVAVSHISYLRQMDFEQYTMRPIKRFHSGTICVIFERLHITRYNSSVATRVRCGGDFIQVLLEFHPLFSSENKLKIR